MIVSELISNLRHLDPNAELVIDLNGINDHSEKIAIESVSPGDDGQVLVTLTDD